MTIVTAIGMSHAPGMLGWPDAPTPSVRRRMEAAYAALSQELTRAKPDVMIAFLDDHFENQYRKLMPTFSVAVAASHSGPAEYWLEALKLKEKRAIPSSPDLAEALLGHLVASDFDVARMGAIEYGNNLIVPFELIRPQYDIPVVPVFINVFTPPISKFTTRFCARRGGKGISRQDAIRETDCPSRNRGHVALAAVLEREKPGGRPAAPENEEVSDGRSRGSR